MNLLGRPVTAQGVSGTEPARAASSGWVTSEAIPWRSTLHAVGLSVSYESAWKARTAPTVAAANFVPGTVRNSTESPKRAKYTGTVSYTHLRAHETDSYLVCRLL